jgi:hypothetical protein
LWNSRRICRASKGSSIISKNNFQIVVPFYNDTDNFKQFVELIEHSHVPKDTFLLLDNGSENKFMEEYYSKKNISSEKWKVIRSQNNLGYGGGIIFASKYTEKDFIAWMPGNMKINPIDAYDFVTNLTLDKKDIYIKARRTNRPFFDSLKTKIFGMAASMYFNTYIYDAGGTPNVVHKDFFKLSKCMPNDFSFDVFVYYFFKVNNLEIKRPKIKYTTRLYGNSHWQKGLISELKLFFSILSYKKEWEIASKKKF